MQVPVTAATVVLEGVELMVLSGVAVQASSQTHESSELNALLPVTGLTLVTHESNG